MEYLVGKGADVNAKNNGGLTALDLARNGNKQDVVDYLRTCSDRQQ